jgi:hypothetical protein
MFCPKCGEELTDVDGDLTCVTGDMQLSPRMRDNLNECFVEKTRMPKDFVNIRIGGTWFCPGCGVRMEAEGGRVVCSRCSRSINEFIFDLVERHPHRLDEATRARLDRWWAENRRKAPTWPRRPPGEAGD